MLKKINMKKGSTVLLVIVFVIAFLALGVAVAYQYGMLGKPKVVAQTAIPAKTVTEDGLKDRSSEIAQLDSGDKIDNIEQDLNKTDINSLDQDVLGVKTEAQGL
mgnify:CR=1 FL=1